MLINISHEALPNSNNDKVICLGPEWFGPKRIRPTVTDDSAHLIKTYNLYAMKEYTEKGSRCKEYASGRAMGNFTRIKYWINYPRNVEFSGFRIQLEY